MAIVKTTFDNSNLNVDYQYTFNHNKNTSDVVATWYDESGIQQQIGSIFQVIDANNVTLNCNGPITGTHVLLLSYDSVTPIITGVRLFERGATTAPSDTMRLALGKAGTPSINYEWGDIKELLFADLSFLKEANNLNDVNDVPTSQQNLNVYSRDYINSALDTKAELYQAGSGTALGVANTATYDPSSDYHPATKKYADDLAKVIEGDVGVGAAFVIDETNKTANITASTLFIKRVGNIVQLHGSIENDLVSQSAFLRIGDIIAAWRPTSTGQYTCEASYSVAFRFDFPAKAIIQVNSSGEIGLITNFATSAVAGVYLTFAISWMI